MAQYNKTVLIESAHDNGALASDYDRLDKLKRKEGPKMVRVIGLYNWICVLLALFEEFIESNTGSFVWGLSAAFM